MDEPHAAVPNEDAGPTRIELRYESRMSEILRSAAWAGRRSDLSFAIGLAAIAGAVFSFAIGDRLTFWFPLLLGLSLVTGGLMVPLVWFAIRRQPNLVGGRIEDDIDDTGIHERTPLVDAKIVWDLYREVVETGDSVYLVSAAGVGFLPKRAFSPDQLEAFRRLVTAKGLVKGRRFVRRIVVTVVTFAVLGAVGFVPLLLSQAFASAPRVDLRPLVGIDSVSVTASTDLPDGTSVVLEVFHVDEYERSVARGGSDSADNEWVEYAWLNVHDGSIESDFDIAHWPAGRGRAVVWVTDGLQEPAVAEWFAERSASFSGPNVSRLPDGLLELRYWQDFEVP